MSVYGARACARQLLSARAHEDEALAGLLDEYVPVQAAAIVRAISREVPAVVTADGHGDARSLLRDSVAIARESIARHAGLMGEAPASVAAVTLASVDPQQLDGVESYERSSAAVTLVGLAVERDGELLERALDGCGGAYIPLVLPTWHIIGLVVAKSLSLADPVRLVSQLLTERMTLFAITAKLRATTVACLLERCFHQDPL